MSITIVCNFKRNYYKFREQFECSAHYSSVSVIIDRIVKNSHSYREQQNYRDRRDGRDNGINWIIHLHFCIIF